MITLQEFCHHLNVLFASDTFTDVCPNGLQVEGKQKITRAATAVSASEEVIDAAINLHADVLIVHHGLFWLGDSFAVTGVKMRKLKKLFDHGISLVAYHVPLEAHQEIGNNWKAALDMKLDLLEPFGVFKGQPIGVKGKLGKISAAELTQHLETYYMHPAHYAPGGPDKIETVALISGGAHWSIKEAIQQKVDAFITGSFDEPIWHLAKEEGIHFFALGHAATERIGPIALAEYLQAEFNLPCDFIDRPNPF